MTAPAIALDAAATRVATRPPSSTGRTRLIAAVLALGAATSAAVLLFRPWPVRNSFEYAELAPVRDGIWTALLVDSLAFAAVAIALALGVAGIVRGRGSSVATIGAVLSMAGGVLFAMGAFAFASLTWYVTDPAILPAPDGTRVLGQIVASPEHVLLPQLLGFLLILLGTLVLAAALFRSRAVPRWLPLAIVGLHVAQFGFHDRALDAVQIASLGALVVLALYLVRSPASTEP